MINPANSAATTPPREVCGHAFVRWLKPDVTALCRTSAGRALVLKRLDRDCLLDGNLHPEILERLARIREIAHGQVATLIAVERDAEGSVYTVWTFIEATPLLTWLCDPLRDVRVCARMLRELVIAVESLHDQGIIHGAIHDGNVVVDIDGRIRLLDISPLLFDDDREDIAAIGNLIREAIQRRGDEATPVGRALLKEVNNSGQLREISAAISRAMHEPEAPKPDPAASDDEHRVRREAMKWTIACTLFAVLVAMALWWWARGEVATPPEAPRQALEVRN